MRPNVLLMTGRQHGRLSHKEEFSTNSAQVKVLLLQNHSGINATHAEPYCIQETPTHGAKGFAVASAPLTKSGLINLTAVLYPCARRDTSFYAVPSLTSLKQGERKTLISAELPDKIIKCSLFYTSRCRR